MALPPKGPSLLTAGHGHAPATSPAPHQDQCRLSSPAPSRALCLLMIFMLDYVETAVAHMPTLDKVNTPQLNRITPTDCKRRDAPKNQYKTLVIMCILFVGFISVLISDPGVLFPLWYYFFTGWSNYPQTSERVTYKSSSKPRARFLSGPVSLSICLYLLSSGIASLVFLFYFRAFSGFVSLVLSIASCFAVLLGCLVFCLTPPLALMFLFVCLLRHKSCLFKPVNSNIFKAQ